MVAGEYAVLEPHQSLIVTAVDRFVYIHISESERNLLTLVDFQLHNIRWEFKDQEVFLDTTERRSNFVRAAMAVTLNYLQEKNIALRPISLSVYSELDDDSGNKYGLGSSAAVVTGVVTALLTEFLAKEPERELIFKLSAIAHVKVQGTGSGADIAASTYGGMLEYRSFQADWLLDQLKRESSATALVQKEWKFLHIKKLSFPKEWKMIVGWTGSPASTAKLVPEILAYKDVNPEAFREFVEKSSRAVLTILTGINQRNFDQFSQGIQMNHKALSKIGKLAGVPIETPKLYELQKVSSLYQSPGKLSGAGGGDCGIAFTVKKDNIPLIKRNWEKAGIKFLEMTHWPYGVSRL